MACYYSMWLNLPLKQTDNVEFQLPDFPEAGEFHVNQLTSSVLEAGENDPFTIFQRRNLTKWRKADAILFNTVEELGKTGLTYFRRKLELPVSGIGPILLSEQDRSTTGRKSTNIGTGELIEWLDEKETNSVIYISFGSQNRISESQMMNLAKALDSSGKNFIWVVRPPLGFDINAEFLAEQWLPLGFTNRVHKRGLIVEKWAPRVEILAHRSVGAFISHSGWNSVLESLKNGVPMLSWPIAGEQFYNAKYLVEEIGVCVEVLRESGCEVREEGTLEKIELVMGENEKGKEMRRKAMGVKEIMRDGLRDEGVIRLFTMESFHP